MAEYIEREAAIEMLKRECSPKVCAYLSDEINLIPAADVREVKRGKWTNRQKEPKHRAWYTCSECKGMFDYTWHYCPNCGADMREES